MIFPPHRYDMSDSVKIYGIEETTCRKSAGIRRLIIFLARLQQVSVFIHDPSPVRGAFSYLAECSGCIPPFWNTNPEARA